MYIGEDDERLLACDFKKAKLSELLGTGWVREQTTRVGRYTAHSGRQMARKPDALPPSTSSGGIWQTDSSTTPSPTKCMS